MTHDIESERECRAAFDAWPGWKGPEPIWSSFRAGWLAALASHAPSDPITECKVGWVNPALREPSETAAQPTEKYDRKQVPELTISDEIRLGMRKLCGHIAECDCQNGIYQAEIEHKDH